MSRIDLRAMPDEDLYRLYADRSRTLVAIAADIGWDANSVAALGAAAADRLGLPRRRPVPPQAAQARAA